MSRYTKLDPRNPAAGMRYTKTYRAQEKDRIRADLDAAMAALGIRLSRKTLGTLDKRLGSDGLGELLTELRALIERIRPVAEAATAARMRSVGSSIPTSACESTPNGSDGRRGVVIEFAVVLLGVLVLEFLVWRPIVERWIEERRR